MRIAISRGRGIFLIGIALLVVLAVLVLAVGPPVFMALTTATDRLRFRIAILRFFFFGYPVVWLGVLIAGASLGACLLWARRNRGPTRRLARGLLVCVSTVLGLVIGEATASAWLRWNHRLPDLPTAFGGQNETRVPGELDIVVLGESSAAGVPYEPWLSVGEIVGWQLRRVLPNRTVRVDVLAEAGLHIEQMHQKLARLRRRPDAVILYAGHNELYSGLGWDHEARHYRDDDPAHVSHWLAARLVRFLPVCRLLDEAIERMRLALPPPDFGRRLVDAPVHTPIDRARRLADFGRRIEAIAAYCDRIGAMAILVIPPGNDAGFEPNRSILPATTSKAARAAFAREVMAARSLEARDPARARSRYEALLARQPGFAECHFRLARLLEAGGEFGASYDHYVQARDLDGHPMRCPSDFQDAYRAVARRHDALLIDGQGVLRTRHPHGLLDDHLFNDAMHPSLEGHVALAEAILAGLKARGSFGWPAATGAPSVELAACAAHFGIDAAAWERVCRFAAGFYTITGPIRYDSSERWTKRSLYAGACDKVAGGVVVDSLGVPGLGTRAVRERFGRAYSVDRGAAFRPAEPVREQATAPRIDYSRIGRRSA
jgi:lysophospholipase L1-like esterase